MLKKMRDWKLKKKLNYGYNISIALMVVSAVISIIGLVALYGSMNSFVSKVQRADTAVKQCRIDANIAARSIREMALYLTMDPEVRAQADANANINTDYKARVDDMFTEIESELDALKNTGVVATDLYNRYEAALQAWGETGYEIIDLLEKGSEESVAQAEELIFIECVPKLTEVANLAKEIDAQTDNVKKTEMFSVQMTAVAVGALVIAFVVIAFVVSKKIGHLVVKSILTPVQHIQVVAEDLSKGNLHSNLDYKSKDELGQLSDSLRGSLATLSSYVDDLSRSMGEFAKGNFSVEPAVEWKGDFKEILNAAMTFQESMAKTVTGIQRVAGQVSGGSEQVAASSMDLAQGATDQAGVTEELTATIENVAEQVAMNAESAKEISKRVADVAGEVNSCDEKMKEMVSAMSEINSASREISKIIATINDIASQTNLLALNASIEAARAGEAGKGFAVVADQVSVLASQSADAAKESTALIETSVKAVEKGMIIADETAGQLVNVVSGAETVSEEVNKVAAALEEQADSMNQINEGVGQINDVVQTNSATSEECAAASQEMSGQAEALKELIRQFKVQDYEGE